MKSKSKKIIGILGAVILAVAVWYALVNYQAPSSENNQANTEEPTPPPSDSIDPNWKKYSSEKYKFSIEYPIDFIVNETHTYMALGPGKEINGIAFIISEDFSKGTNLSSDSYFSVEQLPEAINCRARDFLSNVLTENTVEENGRTYNVATSTDAGAGNRYEETVFATELNGKCYGLRVMIHSTAIENYEHGTVKEFQRQELINLYNQFRTSFTSL